MRRLQTAVEPNVIFKDRKMHMKISTGLLLSFFSFSVIAADKELIAAVLEKNCERVKAELKEGASPRATFKESKNRNEVPIIFVATANVDECSTRALLEHGEDINRQVVLGENEKDMFAATPLIYAIRYNKDLAVELILKFNPDLNPKTNSGEQLMDHPLIFPENFVTTRTIRIKELLGEHGAHITK